MTDEVRQRTTRGVTWSLVASAAGQGSTFLVSLMVARLLRHSEFGSYVMLQSTLLTVSALASFAMASFTAKYVAEFRSSDPLKAGEILGLCSVASAVVTGLATAILVAGSGWLARVALGNESLAWALMAGAAYVYFTTVSGYQIGALSGFEAYRSLAAAAVGASAITLVICGAFTLWMGLRGAILGLSLSAVLRWMIHAVVLQGSCRKAGIRARYGAAAKHLTLLRRFALPAALGGYVSAPAMFVASAMTFHQVNGASEMALYGAAATFRTMALFLPNVVHGVTLSILNNHRRSEDVGGYLSLYWQNVRLVLAAAMLPSAMLAAVGVWTLGLFGSTFEAAYGVLLVLLISAVFEALSSGLYQIVQSQERMWRSLPAISLPREALLVVLAFFLVGRYGAMGLAVACAGQQVFGSLLTLSAALPIARGLQAGRRDTRMPDLAAEPLT